MTVLVISVQGHTYECKFGYFAAMELGSVV